jgi:hypothetical protein
MSIEDIKEVSEKKDEILEQKKEVPEKKVKDHKISLINFKIKYNIPEMDYAGLREILKKPLALEVDVFSEKYLKKSLDKFNKMDAFLKED